MKILSRLTNKIYKYIYKRAWYEIIYFWTGKKYVSLYDKYIGQKKIFLLMEPEYGNLGDHAIAYASEKFINDKFPEYKLISVSESDTCIHLKSIKAVCEEGDLFFIQGGGNMGSLYPYIERMRRFCVKKIKNNPVICLPVSVYFENNFNGRKELKKSINVYNSSTNLIIYTRDIASYDYLRRYVIRDNVKLVPDMVFYLAGKTKKEISKNEDYLVCLRKEKESAIGEEKREEISRILLKNYNNVFLYDTTIWRTVNIGFREIELDTLFRMFSRAKCVITDRMHGMIIAFIMGTPCVVLESFDTKILGSYEWIKDSKKVRIIRANEIENISKYIDDICEMSEQFDFVELHKKFDNMGNDILNGRY